MPPLESQDALQNTIIVYVHIATQPFKEKMKVIATRQKPKKKNANSFFPLLVTHRYLYNVQMHTHMLLSKWTGMLSAQQRN